MLSQVDSSHAFTSVNIEWTVVHDDLGLFHIADLLDSLDHQHEGQYLSGKGHDTAKQSLVCLLSFVKDSDRVTERVTIAQ